MNYATAVIHKVKDLDLAQALLSNHFDFSPVKEIDDQMELTNGALSILLVKDRQDGRLSLAVNSNDLPASAISFIEDGFTGDSTPKWIGSVRQEIQLLGPAGIHLTLYHDYDEDELGVLPELPKSMVWDEDADSMTRQLLKSVPIPFRDNARDRVTKIAEADAIVGGDACVSLKMAGKAMLKTAPDFQHEVLKEGMRACGLKPESFISV